MGGAVRPQCSVYVAASLDGFIARPDGGIDWLDRMQRPGEDYGFQRFLESVDTVVLGRKTYDVALGFGAWPYAGKRVVVLTHAPRAPRHGEEFFAGAFAALVERLGAAGARRVYVDGGTVISELLRAGLVDDLTVSVIPVLLGDGIRLFHSPMPEQQLELEGSSSFPSGLVQLRYRRASRP
jgi:dihydrofolate reductase